MVKSSKLENFYPKRKETFMLVLSRKLDESLIIDGRIEIVVTGISGNKVALGISAPGEVSIYRKELCPVLGEDVPKRRDPDRGKSSCWRTLKKVRTVKNSVR